MDNTPKVKVVMYISGDNFEPDEISKVLNIQATTKYWKDARIKEYAKSLWALKTDKIESWDIASVFHELIGVLRDKKEILNLVTERYNCECRFTFNIWIEENERPEMLLSREDITFINDIHADVAFDYFSTSLKCIDLIWRLFSFD